MWQWISELYCFLFCCLCSGSCLVQWTRPVWKPLVKGMLRNNKHLYENILKLDQWFRKTCCFKMFVFVALVATMFSRIERFKQFRKLTTLKTSVWNHYEIDSFVKQGEVVWKGGWTDNVRSRMFINSSPRVVVLMLPLIMY